MDRLPGALHARHRGFVEAAGLLVAVVCAEALLGSIGSPGLHPHPYWLVVLPVAVRHGRGPALFASGAATALFLFGLIVTRAAPPIGALFEPALFLGVAIYVGGTRSIARGTGEEDGEEASDETSASRAPDMAWREVGTPAALGERLRLEYERGARHGTPIGVLALHFFLWRGDAEGASERLHSHLLRQFAGTLRASDAVYGFGLPGCFVGVLPHTPGDVLDAVRERLDQRSAHSPIHEIGPLKIDVIATDVSVPDVESLLERLRGHFHSQALVPLGEGGPPTPPARVPLRGLREFALALRTEVNLAGREGEPLSVVALSGVDAHEAPPDLLAQHVDCVAPRTLRASDTAFAVGPNHVAVVLPRTRPPEAAVVGQRLAQAIADAHAGASYGELVEKVLEFDRAHPDPQSFLTTLENVAPLSELAN